MQRQSLAFLSLDDGGVLRCGPGYLVQRELVAKSSEVQTRQTVLNVPHSRAFLEIHSVIAILFARYGVLEMLTAPIPAQFANFVSFVD